MAQSSVDRYHRSAIILHWVSAVLIIAMFALGKVMNSLPLGEQRTMMLQGHVAFGLIVTALTIARIVSFLRFRHPAPQPMPGWERLAFLWNHRLLYVVLLLLAVSGSAMLLAGGMAPLPGTLDPARIPDVAPRTGHSLLGTLLALMFVMHVAGVLAYQLRRGGTLARMGVGNR